MADRRQRRSGGHGLPVGRGIVIFVLCAAVGATVARTIDIDADVPLSPPASPNATAPTPAGLSADTKIIGGHPATANATLHQISLRLRRAEAVGAGRGMKCGGSLITVRSVLTAAHCLFEELPESTGVRPVFRRHAADELLVVAGQLWLTQYPPIESRLVSEVRVHPNYTHQLRFDLGVLRLAVAMPTGALLVRPIQLQQLAVQPGTVCQVTGWGTTDYKSQVLNNQLLSVDVPLIDTRQCNNSYAGQLDAAMICAGDDVLGGRDSCQGDSGGPLVCDGQLTGIVSFGKDCGTAQFPGVYVNVSFYREWIVANANGAQRLPGIGVGVMALLMVWATAMGRLA